MRIHIQAAIQVDAQERIQRLVPPAILGFLNGIAQVDPDAVAHAVVVVVDIPRPDSLPERISDLIFWRDRGRNDWYRQISCSARIYWRYRYRVSPIEMWMIIDSRPQHDLPLDRRNERGIRSR